MNRRIKALGVLAVVALAATGCGGGGASTGGGGTTLEIGVDVPFQGSAKDASDSTWNAMELYMEQINHKVVDTAVWLPIVADKALNYRNPRLTNVFINDAFGEVDFQALGVSDGK